MINYKAGEYRRISASARRQAASHPSAPRTERIFYALLLAAAAAAYMLFTSQMVRNYKQMLERYYLWQEAMDVELLSVTALAAVFVPTLLKSRPEGQNNIA